VRKVSNTPKLKKDCYICRFLKSHYSKKYGKRYECLAPDGGRLAKDIINWTPEEITQIEELFAPLDRKIQTYKRQFPMASFNECFPLIYNIGEHYYEVDPLKGKGAPPMIGAKTDLKAIITSILPETRIVILCDHFEQSHKKHRRVRN